MQMSTFTTPDGFKIHNRYWQPAAGQNGVVILVHGIGEHIGRYEHVAAAISAAGFHVYGLDHRGHGQSSGIPVHFDRFDDPVRDLYQFYGMIKANHPDDDIFMLGHSMGSIISLKFVLDHPNTLKALVVTGTATDVGANVSGALRTIANVLKRIAPKLPIQPPLGADVLTNDPEMQQKWEKDPLVYRGSTRVGIGSQIVETGELIQENAHKITLPILIMHGEDDALTPISGSKIMYERVGSTDKTLRTFPGMQHEVMNEIDREKVIAEIIEWIKMH